MAKKSFFEKLGLVEGVAASEYEMPEKPNDNVLLVCSGVGDHYINGDLRCLIWLLLWMSLVRRLQRKFTTNSMRCFRMTILKKCRHRKQWIGL